MDMKDGTCRVIYLAGGCFWGMEKLMRSLPGVTEVASGYANGLGAEYAQYKTVCGGQTGFRETVRVAYDPSLTSLEALLFAYFAVIDPTLVDRQGGDTGSQYQAGVYYADDASKAIVERIAAIEAAGVPRFTVELKPLKNFYAAEEYHQRYLDKNPGGYCHIPFAEIALLSKLRISPSDYSKPAKELALELSSKLAPEPSER